VAYIIVGLLAFIGFIEYCCFAVAGRADRQAERQYATTDRRS
jgi:hypothetical protein